MTLLELVVVIAILAVLTTVAVRSLTGVASQSRFEATQRTLENIQDAVLGPANDHQPDGSRVISGFISDLGRLPAAQPSADGTSLTLDELLVQPTNDLPFAVRPATAANVSEGMSDPEVSIPCGWRGPYLRLPVGESEISDGWGFNLANAVSAGTNFICLRQADSSPANVGDGIAIVGSPGADGVQGGSGYNSDLSVTISPNNFLASLSVNVSLSDTNGNSITALTGGDSVLVSVFGPDPAPANSGKILVQTLTNSLTGPCLFTNFLTQGPRAIRAYYFQSGTNTSSSAIDYLNLHAGFNNAGLTLIRPY